ncbi:MAG TPA: hypothetical protein VLQ29_00180 [Candidatus Dormibacteraeota bacterium]|nr:hypothetical protein [Candidatus Dormibacteraeota bacterium]
MEKKRLSDWRECPPALPEPIELAFLAAILTPGLKPGRVAYENREIKAALRRAMQFYLEATFFYQELSEKSLDELITELGCWPRVEEWLMERRKPKATLTLEHDPLKEWNEDPARRYLGKHGLRFKRPKALLNHMRLKSPGLFKGWRASLTTMSLADFFCTAETFLAAFRRTLNGRDVYDLPIPVLDQIVQLRREQKRRKVAKGLRKKSRQIKS